MVFPFLNMLSVWVFLLSVIILMASFFVSGGPTGGGWTLYPPQTNLAGTPGHDMGIVLMLVSLAVFIVAATMGGLNYVVTVLQYRCRGLTMMRLPLTGGHFCCHTISPIRVSSTSSIRNYDAF